MSGLLPNLIIGGAPKCGTSSLHAWLADHPDALGSDPKETYYFVDPETHMHDPARHAANGLERYRALFVPVPGRPAPRIVFESTPSYLYSRTALALLPELEPSPHFVFIVREPAAQIRSLYVYFRENWNWIPPSMTFAEFVAAARTGSGDFRGNELARHALEFADYRPFLERWRDRVGPGRMSVCVFEEMIAAPRAFMARLCERLGLDPGFYDGYAFGKENETYRVRWRPLQDLNVAVRAKLPKNAAYRWIRQIYRALNTARPEGPTRAEQTVMDDLRVQFAQANTRLATSFGLDLSGWARA